MKKILIIAERLNTGGITTFLVNTVNFYASQNLDVTLAYVGDSSGRIKSLNPAVHTRQIGTLSRFRLFYEILINGYIIDYLRIKYRKKCNKQPIVSIQKINHIKAKYSTDIDDSYDIAISSSEFFCNNYLSLKVNAHKKIGWIHPHYGSLNTDVELDKKTLDQLDVIITVSDESKKSLVDIIPEYSKKVQCIQNLLNDEEIVRKSGDVISDMGDITEQLVIVTVSRLDNSSKRIDRQIDACKKLKSIGVNLKWFIIGDGNDRDFLESLVLKYGLKDIVIFLGEKRNPYPYIKAADVFVLSSQYEGRPIVVDEALILGTPVIVSNYKSAYEQIPSEYGAIIPNDDKSFVLEIVKYIVYKEKLIQYRENLLNFKYDKKKICDALLNLLDN